MYRTHRAETNVADYQLPDGYGYITSMTSQRRGCTLSLVRVITAAHRAQELGRYLIYASY